MTVKSRYQKLNQQLYHSSQEAIRTAQQAHNAVTQAQSSLLPQEIQYAEHKVWKPSPIYARFRISCNQDIAPRNDRV